MNDVGYTALGGAIALVLGGIFAGVVKLLPVIYGQKSANRAATAAEFGELFRRQNEVIAQVEAARKADNERHEARFAEAERELDRQRLRERQCSLCLRWSNSRIEELEDALTRQKIDFRKVARPKGLEYDGEDDDTGAGPQR